MHRRGSAQRDEKQTFTRTVKVSQAHVLPPAFSNLKRFSKPKQACINPSPTKRHLQKAVQQANVLLTSSSLKILPKTYIKKEIPDHLQRAPMPELFLSSKTPKTVINTKGLSKEEIKEAEQKAKEE